MYGDKKYLSAAAMLGSHLLEILQTVSQDIQIKVTEIRLREGRPLCLMMGNETYFLEAIINREDLREAFVCVCGWAVHSHQKEMTDGFIAVRGGHRAGIAATAVVHDGQITAVRDITSINMRIAREIYGVADELIRECFSGQTPGILIAGAPASGKTTILRDLARQLACKACGYRKVCIVDESGEIGGGAVGISGNDLGISSDLLFGYPKAKGLQIAIRYLSPQVMICDEICTVEEVEAVSTAANSGVAVITSIHAGNIEELLNKPQLQPLLKTGVFKYFALLTGASNPSHIASIGKAENLCHS